MLIESLIRKAQISLNLTWWFPCMRAASPSFSQHAFSSRALAASKATSMLEHSRANANLEKLVQREVSFKTTHNIAYIWSELYSYIFLLQSPRFLVLYEVKGDLRVSLLLQVSDDALAD